MKFSSVFASLSMAWFLFAVVTASSNPGDHHGLAADDGSPVISHLRKRELQTTNGFVVDGSYPVGDVTRIDSYFGDLVAFDNTTETTVDETTAIWRLDPDLQAGTTVHCAVICSRSLGIIHLLVKSGSPFMSENDFEFSCSSAPGRFGCGVEFTSTTAGPHFAMAYTKDGLIVNGKFGCDSFDLPIWRGDVFVDIYGGQGHYFDQQPGVGIGIPYNFWDSTRIMRLFANDNSDHVPASTEITCEVACDTRFGGEGILEMKFGQHFATIGQGDFISNNGAYSSCPFSVTGTSPVPPDENGWLLLYSNAPMYGISVRCTAPTLAPTDYPTFSPTLAPTDYPTVSPTTMPTPDPTLPPTLGPTPTPLPTTSPTPMPTPGPTPSPTPRDLQPTNALEVDGSIRINENNVFYFGGLPAFDDTTGATLNATTAIYRVVPDLPATVSVTCQWRCSRTLGVSHLLAKWGSPFTSIHDFDYSTSTSPDCYEAMVFTTDKAGPVFLMAYTEGGFANAYFYCFSKDLPEYNRYDPVLINRGIIRNGVWDVLTYNPDSVQVTTTMIVLKNFDGTIIPASTEIMCQVTCNAGGKGVLEMKFGLQFVSIGEGVPSNSGADQSCPFSVTTTSPATSEEGWLLLYSKTGYMFNVGIECNVPTLAPTPDPSMTLDPTTPSPTLKPTIRPTTGRPTLKPTMRPTTLKPTLRPTLTPTSPRPTTSHPTTNKPTIARPTNKPTLSLIRSNTTWTGNVLLSSSVMVMPEVTLSIVEARVDFENGASILLQINAHVVLARAEFYGAGNGITLLANAATVRANDWLCSGMQVCLKRLGGNSVEVNNSIFVDNQVVFDGYSGGALRAKSCLFARNAAVALTANYEFRDCIFAFNIQAVMSERVQILDSIFMYNNESVQDDCGMNNVVFYRNAFGVVPNCCGHPLSGFSNVSFIENDVAIDARFGSWGIERTNFIDNTLFHIEHRGSFWRATNLYWGTTDLNEIGPYIHAFIPDINDYANYGLMTIEPIATTAFYHGLYNGESPWRPPEHFLGCSLQDLVVPCPRPTPTTMPPTTRPTSRPTPMPTPHPTSRPTPIPTPRPTRRPTPMPTPRPSPRPTPRPTTRPTPRPTRRPTPMPTRRPTPRPTRKPTLMPTRRPTPRPTRKPTLMPTRRPTPRPTRKPTPMPTRRP